jgi:uncharacterized protein YunC (DUF1805 family)
MIETQQINGCLGLKVRMPNANMLLILGEKGYLMCGYLNIAAAEKMGDAAAVVTNVSTFQDVLEAEIKSCTTKARELGVKEGMTGKEALKLLK